MDARFMIEEPGKMVAEMKIRMTIEEWEILRDGLEKNWPASRLSSAITDLLAQARKVFYAEHEVK